MNHFFNLIDEQHIQTSVHVSSKKALFEHIAHHVCALHPSLADEDLIVALSQRERLGSTSIGHGVAIPHCRLNHNKRCIVSLYTLSEPLDYTEDHDSVDLVAAVLAPDAASELHLDILSELAQLLSDKDTRASLRSAVSSEEAFQALLNAGDLGLQHLRHGRVQRI